MKKSEPPLADRIVSVLRFHGYLFETEDYQGLLDFPTDPQREKLLRILSVLRSHAILYQDGYLRKEAETAAEISAMLRYVNGLLDLAPAPIRPAGMIPRYLGSSFVKKGFGFPLFGYYRPQEPPAEEGVLLVYHSPDGDGSARFEGERKTEATRLTYQELGVTAESREPRVFCVISPEDQAPLLIPHRAFENPEPEVFDFSQYIVTLSAEKSLAGPSSRTLDPRSFQFAYFFPQESRMRLNLSRFLKEIFSGRFGVPPGDAENLGILFSQKLLGS